MHLKVSSYFFFVRGVIHQQSFTYIFQLNIYFLLFITITDSLSSDWEKFKSDYNKQYESPAEEAQRQQIFLENVNRIKEYQTTHPDATFTMGINHLTDQRIEVGENIYLKYKKTKHQLYSRNQYLVQNHLLIFIPKQMKNQSK